MSEPNLEAVKALLNTIREQFDAIRELDESVAAAELKSIKTAFKSLLERLPEDAGGEKADEKWAGLLEPQRQPLFDELQELNQRLDKLMGFVRTNNLLPQRATFGYQLAILIYAAAITAVLLALVVIFWRSGSSTDAIKSIAKVTRLETDLERAGEKTTEAKELLAQAKKEHAQAEQAVLATVNKGAAPSPPAEGTEVQNGKVPPTDPPVTPAKEQKTPPPKKVDGAPAAATAPKPTPTTTAMPAEAPAGEQEQPPLATPVDESAESTADSSSDAVIEKPSPEAPAATSGEDPPGPSPSDAAAAASSSRVAAAHAARAAEQAERALMDRAAAEQATKVAAQHAAVARAERTAADQATQAAADHATAAEAAAKEAAQAKQAALESFTDSVEAPRQAAESIRDAAARRMQAAQQAADAAVAVEAALVKKLADAREKLSQAEVVSHSVGVFTMCLLFGGLGASLRMIGSLGAYIAARKLYRSWLVYYYCMPPEGALVGIAIYLVLGAGLFTPGVEGRDASQFGNPLYIYALAMLVGTFAKNSMQKLRDIADAAFGKPSRQDALPE